MAEDLGPLKPQTRSMRELRKGGTKSMLHPGQTMPAEPLAHPGQTRGAAKPLAHPGQTADAAANRRAQQTAAKGGGGGGGRVTKSSGSSGKPLSEIVKPMAAPAEGFGARFKKAWANRGPDMQRLAKERMEKSGRKG